MGDNFIVGGITGLVAEFPQTRPDAQIMLTWVSYPRSFGVTELDESCRVIGLEEKPRAPKSDLALVGVYLFAPVASAVITGYWKDTGSVADMLEVNRLVLETVGPRLGGTAGDGCEIEYSIVLRGASIRGVRRIEVQISS